MINNLIDDFLGFYLALKELQRIQLKNIIMI